MKTKTEWDQDILNITMKIQQEYPELYKYIQEMPVKISTENKADVNIKNLEEYHNSLVELLAEYAKTHTGNNEKADTAQTKFPGYPEYPASEDIYSKGKKQTDLNPNDLTKKKASNAEGSMNEKDFKDDILGDDLDVPGAELDDEDEKIGTEDEENNYYSLGGDNHNNLDEANG
jgi:hypothetical protein